MAASPFAAVVAGRAPAFLQPIDAAAQRYTLAVSDVGRLNHICLFCTESLPPNIYAAVYFLLPSSPDWRELGSLKADKPSAIFALKNLVNAATASAPQGAFSGMAQPGLGPNDALLGLMLQEGQPESSDNALVLASTAAAQRTLEKDPVKLATAIGKNLFGYLSGFAKPLPPELTGGQQDVLVVELSAVQRWLVGIQSKLKYGVGFLAESD